MAPTAASASSTSPRSTASATTALFPMNALLMSSKVTSLRKGDATLGAPVVPLVLVDCCGVRDQVKALIKPEVTLGASVGLLILMDGAIVTVRVALLIECLAATRVAANMAAARCAGVMGRWRVWSGRKWRG